MCLQELIIYTNLSCDTIINKYISFITETDSALIRKAYFDLIKDLISIEMSFETYLYTKMIEVDNPVLERLSHKNYNISMLDKSCLKNDLDIIKSIINSNIDDKIHEADDGHNILRHIVSAESSSDILNAYKSYFNSEVSVDNNEDISEFINILRTYGTGIFSENNVFYINQQDQLTPVKEFLPLPWEQIYDYQIQKEELLDNTKSLVEGYPYNHVLLEGASGTGKSSCVKAVADLFKGQKLRLIQLYKSQLCGLPSLLRVLNRSIFKFIIFLDDLSFEPGDEEYKLLKSYIEGGIINEADNIAFYVTSNRQHLIKEVRAEREGDVHLQDSIQEATSLSERFGLHLTFNAPNQIEYISIILNMLKSENISFNQDEIELEAKRWALLHRGMSGRVAMQFVKHLKMNV